SCRPVTWRVGIVERPEQLLSALPAVLPHHPGDSGRCTDPAVRIIPRAFQLAWLDAVWRAHLKGQPADHGVVRAKKLGQHRGKRFGSGPGKGRGRELPGPGTAAAGERLELTQLLRRRAAAGLLRIGQAPS